MAIGTSGGNDQGASLEVQFDVAGEVGREVLKTAKARSELKVYGDRPNILFLEPEKFSPKYVEGLNSNGKASHKSIEVAKMSSLGLSIEAALQVVEAKSYKSVFVEDTGSLADISRMLGRSAQLVETESQKSPKLLVNVVKEISEKRSLGISDDHALVEWANENLSKAKQRIDKKIVAIDEANRAL